MLPLYNVSCRKDNTTFHKIANSKANLNLYKTLEICVYFKINTICFLGIAKFVSQALKAGFKQSHANIY